MTVTPHNDKIPAQAPVDDDNVEQAVRRKVDAFLRKHVIPVAAPKDVTWWFSLSGGKDSYTMFHAVREWYADEGEKFIARCFVINQWQGLSATNIGKLLQPIRVDLIDAVQRTIDATGYEAGQQAPCRRCADVRRDITDEILANADRTTTTLNIVARGLHLSDTAISVMWRIARGRCAITDLNRSGKINPIVKIGDGVFLAKPLFYVREYEAQRYAADHGFRPTCCGCPACAYPARRDIVEESLRLFFEGDLWELDVPGVVDLMRLRGGDFAIDLLKHNSARGRETKTAHLPAAFPDFATNRFREHFDIRALTSAVFKSSESLDAIGIAHLKTGTTVPELTGMPLCDLLSGKPLDHKVASVVAAFGPFWGMFALGDSLRKLAIELQYRMFGLNVDDELSHVGRLLREFYEGGSYGTHGSAAQSPLHFISGARANVGCT